MKLNGIAFCNFTWTEPLKRLLLRNNWCMYWQHLHVCVFSVSLTVWHRWATTFSSVLISVCIHGGQQRSDMYEWTVKQKLDLLTDGGEEVIVSWAGSEEDQQPPTDRHPACRQTDTDNTKIRPQTISAMLYFCFVKYIEDELRLHSPLHHNLNPA